MNTMKHGMFYTIESCGRTLLDKINNLLDLSLLDRRSRLNENPREKLSDLPSGSTEGDRV